MAARAAALRWRPPPWREAGREERWRRAGAGHCGEGVGDDGGGRRGFSGMGALGEFCFWSCNAPAVEAVRGAVLAEVAPHHAAASEGGGGDGGAHGAGKAGGEKEGSPPVLLGVRRFAPKPGPLVLVGALSGHTSCCSSR